LGAFTDVLSGKFLFHYVVAIRATIDSKKNGFASDQGLRRQINLWADQSDRMLPGQLGWLQAVRCVCDKMRFQGGSFMEKASLRLEDFSLDELEQLQTFFTRAYFLKIARSTAAQDGADDLREDNPTLGEKVLRALGKIQKQLDFGGQNSPAPIL
jgi:hypothetical protein